MNCGCWRLWVLVCLSGFMAPCYATTHSCCWYALGRSVAFHFLEWFKIKRKANADIYYLSFFYLLFSILSGTFWTSHESIFPFKGYTVQSGKRTTCRCHFDLNSLFHVYFVVCSILGLVLLSCSSIWPSKSSGIQHDSSSSDGRPVGGKGSAWGTKQHGAKTKGKKEDD